MTGRLVTLTGAGGVGKTRLAVEVARAQAERYADGVWLVELAAVDQGPGSSGQPVASERSSAASDAAGVAASERSSAASDAAGVAASERSSSAEGSDAAAVAAQLVRVISTVLGLDGDALGPAEDIDDLVEQLARVLRERESLLVLDNCEHVIGPVAKLAGLLLRAAAGLRVLATSREPLEVPGELLWDVPPLELPDPAVVDPAVLVKASAVQLFVARAAAADAAFRLGTDNARAVAGICVRLDGIPLALELAATRVRTLGVHEVAERLDDRFRLLSAGLRGAPARQQTLRAVIDWSWGLLSDPERTVLRRLALHADSCTRQAAEAICAGDGVVAADVPELLARLVDRSLLVRIDAPGGARYRLLESVGAYCLERLHESGEFERVLQQHLAYYIGLSTQSEPRLYGHHPLFTYLSEKDPRRQVRSGPKASPAREPASTVRSRDGTAIAYDRYGQGPPVILIGGALNERLAFEPLARQLAPEFTVYSYDRRGRGGSGDTPPYQVSREIEDLAALVELAGGPVYGFGVSSGAVLAVEAAAAGLAIAGLVLIEPPFIMDDTRTPVPAGIVARLDELVATGRRGDAVELFLTEAVEMPAEVVAPMRSAPTWAALEAVAHTISYDMAIMGDFQLPGRWAAVTVPTLILDGGESARWRQHAARVAAATMPNASHRTLAGHAHDAPPEILAPLMTEFYSS
jgi:predicted ATPase/pimeloyl-ACP methyl ester carboxylesterase